MQLKSDPKRFVRALIVGFLGILVLSLSAFAAWGSSTGYDKYKTALTALFTEIENVTVEGSYDINYDGDIAHHSEILWKIDGHDYTQYEKSVPSGDNLEYANELYISVFDYVETVFYNEEYYEQYFVDPVSSTTPLATGEFGNKALLFGELLADAVVGDLKNNVILVDERSGTSYYTLDITDDQIPALVSSGLDLFLTVSDSGSGYVTYEDADAVFALYYKEVKGKNLPKTYFDTLYSEKASEQMWEDYNALRDEMDAHYEAIRMEAGEKTVLNVEADGGYDLYADPMDYRFATGYGSADLSVYLGANAVLRKVHFSFALDNEERLVSNDIALLFHVTDGEGKSHTAEVKIEADFSDYGKTVPVAYDLGDRVLYDQGK